MFLSICWRNWRTSRSLNHTGLGSPKEGRRKFHANLVKGGRTAPATGRMMRNALRLEGPVGRTGNRQEPPSDQMLARQWPWCTDQGCGRNDPYPVLGSCDAGGLRASQLQHAVEHMDRHVHLSRPTLVRTRAQPVPDHALEPADGGLGPGARIVARG